MNQSNQQTYKSILIGVIVLLMACKAPRDCTYTTIPLTYSSTHVTVIPVEINGKTYNFLWDTGTGLSYISRDVAREIDVDTIDKYVKVNVYNSKVEQICPYSDWLRIGFGDIEFNDQLVISRLISGFDGIIGSNLINRYSWLFDFTKREVIVSNKKQNVDLAEADHQFDFGIHYADSLNRVNPHLKLLLNDTLPELFCFDTGLAISRLINNEFVLYEDLRFYVSDKNNFEQCRRYIQKRYSDQCTDFMQSDDPSGVFIYGVKLNGYNPYMLFVKVESDAFHGRNFSSIDSTSGLSGGVVLGSGFLKRFSRMYYDPESLLVSLIVSADNTNLYGKKHIDDFFGLVPIQ